MTELHWGKSTISLYGCSADRPHHQNNNNNKTQGNETRDPFYRRLSGLRGRSGRVRKIFSPPTGIRSPDRPARSESIYRLSYRSPFHVGTDIALICIHLCSGWRFRSSGKALWRYCLSTFRNIVSKRRELLAQRECNITEKRVIYRITTVRTPKFSTLFCFI
jgi:hypothetical protein